MKIITINIRGLGNATKWRYINELNRKEGAGMICIQETKMKNINKEKCFKLWDDNNVEWLHKEAMEGAGGILTVWHKNVFVCERNIVGKGFMVLIGRNKEKDIPIVVVNVYLACTLKDKCNMWEEIINIRKTEGCKTWCMVGDFNAVRKPDERKGVSIGHANKKEILGFNEFIDKIEMLEIPFVGRKYTWYRPNGNAKSRIDRIFVSDKWLEHWPGYKQYI